MQNIKIKVKAGKYKNRSMKLRIEVAKYEIE